MKGKREKKLSRAQSYDSGIYNYDSSVVVGKSVLCIVVEKSIFTKRDWLFTVL
jgi:hypothetical protein